MAIGATGPAPNQIAATAHNGKLQTNLELEKGPRQIARRNARPHRSQTKTDGANNVVSIFDYTGDHTGPTGAPGSGLSGVQGPMGPTGTSAAGTAPKGATAEKRCAKEASFKKQQRPNAPQPNPDTQHALDFFDDFFGSGKRHLTAIKKSTVKDGAPIIKARHFGAADREGQQKFITEYGAAGFDIYFGPNPIKGTLHKKATKNDVAEATHLWIDLDPRPNEPLEAERATMLALLTTNLPQGVPRPNRVIDSGRGFWGYWKLAAPQPVDGSKNSVNGPLTDAVERYGRGIEQAFGEHFADGCRNIDRIARLPGTINTKTGRQARVLREFSHEEQYDIETFPRTTKSEDKEAKADPSTASGPYEPVTRDAPELAKLEPIWVTRIFDGDVDGKYQKDRSRLAFAVACELVRTGIDDKFIARVLMTTLCGAHVQESPAYRLGRTHSSRP